MPIQLKEENDGRLLIVNVGGKLVKADYAQLVPEVERLIAQHGKRRMLFDMAGFHGWELGAMWEDFKFGISHFSDIEKLAMVGENNGRKTWRLLRSRLSSRRCAISIRRAPQKRANGWTRHSGCARRLA